MAINWNKIQRKNPKNETKAWYPQVALAQTISADEVIDGIVDKCTLTRVDVKACLVALEEVVIEQLKLGNSVRFGTLGSFRPTIKTRFKVVDAEGNEKWGTGGCKVANDVFDTDGTTIKMAGVHTENIAGINVCFTKSGIMKRKLQRDQLKFRMVAGEIPYMPRS